MWKIIEVLAFGANAGFAMWVHDFSEAIAWTIATVYAASDL